MSRLALQDDDQAGEHFAAVADEDRRAFDRAPPEEERRRPGNISRYQGATWS